MISKRVEEVLGVNDFHKVFRLAKVEIVDIDSSKEGRTRFSPCFGILSDFDWVFSLFWNILGFLFLV